jgi:hypothetical protein
MRRDNEYDNNTGPVGMIVDADTITVIFRQVETVA